MTRRKTTANKKTINETNDNNGATQGAGMRGHGIGIDTGGTYTDVVIIDLSTREVTGIAKTPTTHDDLGLGISVGLAKALRGASIDPRQVELVAVSTTLATNAVVEGKGASVGVILVGFPEYVELPATHIKYVRGGHTLKGKVQEALDLKGLVEAATDLKGQVDAYAVCAMMSVVNPHHELVAAESIRLVDPRPVFCSHQVSGSFGVKERAATAALNAALVPVMDNFLDGVRASLSAHSIDAEVLLVRGDARTVDAEEAIARPATTTMSGPAASAFFGAAAAGVADALIVDVGGTTTDVAIVFGGKPVVRDEGSVIGSWRTHVKAVETFTVGVGGDSSVHAKGEAICVGPRRVQPFALHPELADLGTRLAEGSPEPRFYLLTTDRSELVELDTVLGVLHQRGPTTLRELQAELDLNALELSSHIGERQRVGLIAEVGFTPTDALHVLGDLEFGNRTIATQVAEHLRGDADVDELCRGVIAATQRKIEDTILEHVVRRELGIELANYLSRRGEHRVLDVSMSLSVPIVGIGAAARHIIPAVATSLGTQPIFPAGFEVGNALGAILMASALPR